MAISYTLTNQPSNDPKTSKIKIPKQAGKSFHIQLNGFNLEYHWFRISSFSVTVDVDDAAAADVYIASSFILLEKRIHKQTRA